jgi:1,4-alpha-glucan branching enzyme
MWGHPGKKLLFMGSEFAQEREWNHDRELDWPSIEDPAHAGVQRLVRDLNHLYAAEPALHRRDCEPSGFMWTVGDDRSNSVFAFLRLGPGPTAPILVVSNMTPVLRRNYRIGVPRAAAGTRSSTAIPGTTEDRTWATKGASTPLSSRRTDTRNRLN